MTRIKNFFKSTGTRAKTDRLDAIHIALFAQKMQPEPRDFPEIERLELEYWVARRRQILDMLRMERNRLAICSNGLVQANLEAHIAFLEGQLKETDAALESRVAASSIWSALSETLQSVPGVGRVTVETLIAMLPELAG